MTDRVLKPAVFLDRDGTINVDPGYIRRPSELHLIPGAAAAIRTLNERSIPVVVVSNQSGLARGYFTTGELEAVNSRLGALLAEDGASIDAIYFCPHLPDDGCRCRKPATELVERAATELGVGCSYMVGDKGSDIALARGAGARAVLVKTGHGASELAHLTEEPDFIAEDLPGAVEWILKDLGNIS
jgi:histidinol-phosphate phosphatase family protein